MSELIHNPEKRKELLKHLILQLHNNESPEQVKKRLIHLLHSVPYDEVVEVEQELIAEGLPVEEVLRLCDIHTAVLDGNIDLSEAKKIPEGHPIHTFTQENRALEIRIKKTNELLATIPNLQENEISDFLLQLKILFNELSDVEKHYLRKEYLLFPFIEQAGITGPPKVMWGKHDETREFLNAVHETLNNSSEITKEELESVVSFVFAPAIEAIEGMIMKEEEILFPMAMDELSDENWYQIEKESPIYGFCLYDPQSVWKPQSIIENEPKFVQGNAITLSSGSFHIEELESLFVTLPVDLTYVDKNDKVKFFSHSPNRVFERNRAVIGRDVRLCHPPQSVYIVEQILNDFKSGKENKAVFWMSNFKRRFIYIDYTALRSPEGEYLGVVEITQDITELRKLEGDQRLLSYTNKDK